MELKEIVITPELASEYLSHNTNNRRVKKNVVEKYASDMKNGLWEQSPEPISFYRNGSLRDGQHRLMAIVKANVPVKTYVAFDVPDTSIICDQNVVRSLPDIFTLDGEVPALANQVATGTINFLLRYSIGGNSGSISTKTKLMFAKDNYDTLSKAISICCAGGSGPQISRKSSICSAVFCALMCGYDERVLERFVTVLNTGHEADASEDAAIVARNQIVFGYRTGTAGSAAQKEIFAIVGQAILDFQTCTPRKRKYTTTVDVPIWKRTCALIVKKYANGGAK